MSPPRYHDGPAERYDQGLSWDESLEAATYLANEEERAAEAAGRPPESAFLKSRAVYIDFHAKKFRTDQGYWERGWQALERARADRLGEAEKERRQAERRAMARGRAAADQPHAHGCRCDRSFAIPCPELHLRRIGLSMHPDSQAPLGYNLKLDHEARKADLDERDWLDLPEWVESVGGSLREAFDVVDRAHGGEVFERLESEIIEKLTSANPRLVALYGETRFLKLYPIQARLREEFERGVIRKAREIERGVMA